MRLHISPCPNDTFIFYAMIHNLVDCEGLTFDVTFEDIDRLNQRAVMENVDVIKLSYAVLPEVEGRYTPLRVGGALGYGNGPVLVARSPAVDLRRATIAIPGYRTTAALLLRRLVEHDPAGLRPYLFSDITCAVSCGEVDAGVLIHEGRFTYGDSGLTLIADLGELWNERFSLPIPLGVIAVGEGVDSEAISRVIKRSIEYAQKNSDNVAEFVRKHAAELSAEVRQNHITYFVNDFSLDIGPLGEQAVDLLLRNCLNL